MAACGSLGLNYLPLDGYFSDNNKQSMISSEYGIVSSIFNNPQTKLYQFRENNSCAVETKLSLNSCDPWNRRGGITVT